VTGAQGAVGKSRTAPEGSLLPSLPGRARSPPLGHNLPLYGSARWDSIDAARLSRLRLFPKGLVAFDFSVAPFGVRSAIVQTHRIWWYYGSPEGLSVPHRTLHRLVEEEQQQDGGVFGPDDIAIMTKAFDLLLAECKLTDRTGPVVTMVAKLVIELVRNGERDPEKIRQKIIGRVNSL
jgi:hypothetical protein